MEFINHYLLASLLTIFRYFVIAGIPFIIFYLVFNRHFQYAKIQRRVVSKRVFVSEIAQSMQTTLVFAAVGCIFIYTPLREFTRIYQDIHYYAYWLIPVVLLVSMVIHDTYFYWLHRFIHHPAIFKYVHLVHHRSVNPSPWSSYSFHLLESLAEVIILPILIFILPMHPVTIFLFTFFSFAFNVYGHLGYEIVPRWFRTSWLFRIVGTSLYHNMHHSKFHYNFGLYFRIWDRWMGTEHPDYVAQFDSIQERRFGKRPVKNSTGFTGILLLALLPGTTIGQDLDGYWKDPETGAVVELLRDESDSYSGMVISSGNPEDDRKIDGHQIYVLRDFRLQVEKGHSLYRGTVFLPRRRLTLPATLHRTSENSLIVVGHWGPMVHRMLWERIGIEESKNKWE